MRLAALACLGVSLLLVACSVDRGGGGGPDTAEEALSDLAVAADDLVDRDVVAYAEKCKEELGVTGPLPNLSCTDGQRDRDGTAWDDSRRVEVPITIGGRRVDATTYNQAIDVGCDRAQWLETRCWTYDLVQRVVINPEVDAVLNCRQKYRTSALGIAERRAAYAAAAPNERLAKFRLIYEFDDLGYILRNKQTGKSCFFTSFGVSFYGGWVPAPDRRSIPSRDEIYAMLPEPKPPAGYDERQWNRGPRGHAELPRNMFFTPEATASGGCVGCHNQGAFKHSPFIDQAEAPGIGRIVPVNDRTKPYLLVGRVFQRSFQSNGIVEVDTGEGGENACVGCHRMNSGSYGAINAVEWAVGEDPPAMSAWAAAWPQRAWMKPSHRKPDRASYRAAFGADIDALMCCLQNPSARGCRKRTIGPIASAVRLDAEGNLDPEAWTTGTSGQCLP